MTNAGEKEASDRVTSLSPGILEGNEELSKARNLLGF